MVFKSYCVKGNYFVLWYFGWIEFVSWFKKTSHIFIWTRHQCNVSILLAWVCSVQLISTEILGNKIIKIIRKNISSRSTFSSFQRHLKAGSYPKTMIERSLPKNQHSNKRKKPWDDTSFHLFLHFSLVSLLNSDLFPSTTALFFLFFFWRKDISSAVLDFLINFFVPNAAHIRGRHSFE